MAARQAAPALASGWYKLSKSYKPLYWYDTIQPEHLLEIISSKYSSYGEYYATHFNFFNGSEIKAGKIVNFPSDTYELLVPVTPEEVKGIQVKINKKAKANIAKVVDFGASVSSGSDPEVFVTVGKKVLPAFKFLGDKKTGKASHSYNDAECKPYWDGFQAEFNIGSFSCIAGGMDMIYAQLKKLHELAVKHNPKAKLNMSCVLPVEEEDLTEGMPEHIQLGCAPSKNAYNLTGMKVPDGRELPIRFAGFHIHLGIGENGYGPRVPTASYPKIVKLIDAIAGVMNVCAVQGLDVPERRFYYGLPGEYREPSHGLEYRVLSSTSLWHPALTHLMFNFVRGAAQISMKGLDKVWDASEDEVIETIKNLDVDQAKKILLRNRKVLESMLERYYRDKNQPTLGGDNIPNEVPLPSAILEEIILKGFSQYIDLNAEKNWLITPATWKSHSEGKDCMMWRFAKSVLGAYKGKG